ncbi:hypothetical protein [Pseudobacteriovorax antillogorgiicola]|uniref:SH3 domain-containing protein n=1 Tax=Pseudobacteriovorax antillogorgiicola TaxID=1513793 RepID=A0A1Y6CG84_9BACT|nr:hypothetical protein [Pseudobacteriovorax antillogorgiicola]TCS47350.1 hypothetical protein EDD56_121125 [Pseudobacteriovorax antillogorgiicola]SMF63250.1 hypothetical protein SAMN06296036_121125 [Pseudobacteriovorax antillogorgiicola]
MSSEVKANPNRKGPVFSKTSGLDDLAVQALKAHAQEPISFHPPKTQKSERKTRLSRRRRRTILWTSHLLNILFVLIFTGIGFLSNEIFHKFKARSPVDSQGESRVLLRGTYIVAKKSLSMHRGPGHDYEVVGRLNQGHIIKGKHVIQGWVQVDYGKFVELKSLHKLPRYDQTEFTKNQAAIGQRNIYEEPHEVAEVVGYIFLKKGMLTAELDQDWLMLSSGGFVKKRASPQHEAKLMKVKTKKAMIYNGPSEEYDLVGAFYKNKILRVLESESGWARISKDQFIAAGDLEPVVTQVQAQKTKKKSQP